MKVAVFSSKPYDRRFLEEANQDRLELVFFESRLDSLTCMLAKDFPVVCSFVNDRLDASILLRLFDGKTRMIALRCAGFNNVDFYAAKNLGFTVARVPAYSPRSISEYTVGLILALARKICKAYVRTREANFSLDGLLGFNIADRLIGIVGTGKIGSATAKTLLGFGCSVWAQDVVENPELVALGVRYVTQDEIFKNCDIISLHCPLSPETRHLIRRETIEVLSPGTMLVNTSRGGLIDTEAVVEGLKSGQIGSLAIDVYEEEANYFFEDFSDRVIQDDSLARILNFPNVIVTGHQAFFTEEAMRAIASQTIENILAFRDGRTPPGIMTL